MPLETVLLCGGLGTRLREETETRPKPMVEIGDHPILWHIMKIYAAQGGVRDFLLCLGYKGDVIRDYFLNYTNRVADTRIELASGAIECLPNGTNVEDWRVTLMETGRSTLTGLRLKRAVNRIAGERFFATYGDGVADIDVNALLEHHAAAGKLATVTAVHPSSRFGELELDGHIVSSFAEKPQVGQGWINGGFFVFEKRAFDLLGEDDDISLEDGLLARLAEIGELAVYRHDGFWQCMDTYREMQLLNQMWRGGDAPWRVW